MHVYTEVELLCLHGILTPINTTSIIQLPPPPTHTHTQEQQQHPPPPPPPIYMYQPTSLSTFSVHISSRCSRLSVNNMVLYTPPPPYPIHPSPSVPSVHPPPALHSYHVSCGISQTSNHVVIYRFSIYHGSPVYQERIIHQ